jgi:hypothetical protein
LALQNEHADAGGLGGARCVDQDRLQLRCRKAFIYRLMKKYQNQVSLSSLTLLIAILEAILHSAVCSLLLIIQFRYMMQLWGG